MLCGMLLGTKTRIQRLRISRWTPSAMAMSPLFRRTMCRLQRILIIFVSFQVIVKYLSPCVTCPHFTLDLNELPPMEWSEDPRAIDGPTNYPSGVDKTLILDSAPLSIGAEKHAFHQITENDRASSVGASGRADEILDRNERLTEAQTSEAGVLEATRGQATEARVSEATSSQPSHVVFLDFQAMQPWLRQVNSGRSKNTFPDNVLMSLGIAGYTQFRRRHVVRHNPSKSQRRATLSYAEMRMGKNEIRDLGLEEDRRKLLSRVAKKWFGKKPERGWVGRERRLLNCAQHTLGATLYYIRLLHEMYQPALYSKELKTFQRNSFNTLGVLMLAMGPQLTKTSSLPAKSKSGITSPARRWAENLLKASNDDSSRRSPMSLVATEYCMEQHFAKLEELMTREKHGSIHRNYKEALGDEAIASACQLSDTEIQEGDKVEVNKKFFLSSQPNR